MNRAQKAVWLTYIPIFVIVAALLTVGIHEDRDLALLSGSGLVVMTVVAFILHAVLRSPNR